MAVTPRAGTDFNHRFCVAPMMDCTDRHCRVFHRALSRQAVLYTEMLTSGAVLFGDRERLLGFDAVQHPVALQLGGSDPAVMSEAAAIGESFGYDEVNINAGCPSDRVQAGRFGACLMTEPATVAACVKAMRHTCRVPVTVKCRIGVDDQDAYADLQRFVDAVAAAGCKTVIVHARKAWLRGLSPKENRSVPPLDYQRVYRLKAEFPGLEIVINGGITSLGQAETHLQHVDGVMLGRAAYHDPMLLADVDRRLFDPKAPISECASTIEALIGYLEGPAVDDRSARSLLRHVLGLYQGVPGARAWRRCLTMSGRTGSSRAPESERPGVAVAARLRAAARLIGVTGQSEQTAA